MVQLQQVARSSGALGVLLHCLTVAAVLVVVAVPSTVRAGQDEATITLVEDTGDRIVIEYTLGSYVVKPVLIGEKTYAHVTLGDAALIKEPVGAPELPHIARSVIIPDRAAMGARVLDARYEVIEDVEIVPTKGHLSRKTDPASVPHTFADMYRDDVYWPAKTVELGQPYILRNQRGMVVDFRPFQHNPVRRTLRVCTWARIELFANGPGTVNVLDRSAPPAEASLAFHQIYHKHFLNYRPAQRYAPLDEQGELLIICYDPWLPNIEPLVNHKNAIGIPTTAVGVSTIGTSAAALKSYIQNTYDTSDLAFVLLVGDAAQVPTPYETFGYTSGAVDPTYALVQGSDNYPDIIVGRFSASSPVHVDTQVARTLAYETMPATTQDWFKRATGIASSDGGSWGDDGETDQAHMQNIRTDLLGYGYTVVDEFYENYGASSSQVTNAVNAGRGLINYTGHGSAGSWSTTGFSSSHVNALANVGMLPFICSVACNNGEFDNYGACFAETWLRATSGTNPTGAVGMYASSITQDWAPPMDAQDELVDLLVGEDYFSFGALCFAGSCHMLDQYGSGGVKTFKTWIIFGDPSVRVFGIAEPPTGLKVSPYDEWEASGPIGGPFGPGSRNYILENKNETPLAYEVYADESWLTVVDGTGVLSPLGTAVVNVEIDEAAGQLDRGTYSPVIHFVNTTDHDGDTDRVLTLEIGGPAWDPVAYSGSAATGVSLAVDVSLSASDPNNDDLSYVIESFPAEGHLSDPNGGAIESVPYTLVGGGDVVTYQPPCGDIVQTSFNFSAHDATADSNVATQVITVTESDPRAVYVFDLETDPGWSTEGQWAFGIPAGGGTHAGDPASGHTGDYVYGYNLQGDYPHNLPVKYLTTQALDCSKMSDVTLRFWRWLGVEDFDGATVEVSSDGQHWNVVWDHLGSRISDTTWHYVNLDISAYADGQETVYVRWGMGPTDYSVAYPGWNIDDVAIWGVVEVHPSDFDGDGLVGAGDLARMDACLAGPNGGIAPTCQCKDLDADGDVDLADYGLFQTSYVE